MIIISLDSWIKEQVPILTKELKKIHSEYSSVNKIIGFAGKEYIYKVITYIQTALFPGLYKKYSPAKVSNLIAQNLKNAAIEMQSLIKKVSKDETISKEITIRLMNRLPEIRETLHTDIVAAYNGDPAAKSPEEILLSYPSIQALSIYRIAHVLYDYNVPLIPRIMTEYAHQITGIDIHPGAKIGDYFFIDHGTGVVIGETCTIGNHVKLYQGVTLGAKSFQLDESGNPIKNIKRHPDIEDDVIIYAGATVLGGDTVIGHNSIIGGNVWLTQSVPPFSRVYNAQPSPIIKQDLEE